jgi:hypothetical protein
MSEMDDDDPQVRRQFLRTLGFIPFGRTYQGPPVAEDADPSTWDAETLTEQPTGISRKLFRHQLKSVYDMEVFERKEPTIVPVNMSTPCFHRHRHSNSCVWGHGRRMERVLVRHVGIQADPLGFGKTMSLLSLVARDKFPWDLDSEYAPEIVSATDAGRVTWKTSFRRIKQTLVLVSLSCLDQWIAEISFTQLKCYIVKSKKHIREFEPDDNDCDIVLVTPTMFNRLISHVGDVAWKRFIFDEPAQLSVPTMATVVSGFTWLVTATPAGIAQCQPSSNWVSELIRSMGSCRSIQMFCVRNPMKFVETSFAMPPTIFKDYLCWHPMARHLRGLVNGTVHRMIQAGDIASAMTYLGGTSTTCVRDLVKLVRAKKQRELEQANLFREQWTRRPTSEVRSRKIAEWSARIRTLENAMTRLETITGDDSCPICMDTVENPIIEPACGHLFCATCLLTWCTTNKTCPNCRCIIDASKLVTVAKNVDESKESTETVARPKTKLETIEKIVLDRLNETPEARFIVASQYIGGYGMIKSLLDRLVVPWCVISGAASTRAKKVKSFNEGSVKVIFISNLDSTAGVNLQAATDIILYNDMHPNIRSQIIGRANRIGRKSSVIVHTLFASYDHSS